MPELAPYATAYTFYRKLGLSGDFVTSATIAAGDVKVQIDGGTAANVTTLPTFTNGLLQVTLSTAEMTGKQIVVCWSDQDGPAFDGDSAVIQTIDHPSAALPDVGVAMAGGSADTDAATVAAIVSGGVIAANATQLAGQTVTATGAINADNINSVATDSNNLLTGNAITTVTDQTTFELTSGATEDDIYNGQTVLIYDTSTPANIHRAYITDYDADPDPTITIDRAAPFTVVAGDTVTILATPKPSSAGSSPGGAGGPF